LSRWLSRASYALNRLAPGLKALLPKPLHRWLLLNVVKVNAPYASFDGLASRRFLQDALLPWMRDHCPRILFVGAAPYTHRYEKLFAGRDGCFTTMDVNPAMAVWGTADHIVAPVREILRFRLPGSFDGTILNGVFGYGVDDPAEMRRTVEALHTVLKPGGLLVVGWNMDLHADPGVLGLYDGLFMPSDASPWRQRLTFEGETHVYDLLTRSPA
jgi:SAM-dependent methyltransferase